MQDQGEHQSSWDRYQHLVLSELARLDARDKEREKELTLLKSQIWAAVGSLLAGLIGLLIKDGIGGPR